MNERLGTAASRSMSPEKKASPKAPAIMLSTMIPASGGASADGWLLAPFSELLKSTPQGGGSLRRGPLPWQRGRLPAGQFRGGSRFMGGVSFVSGFI